MCARNEKASNSMEQGQVCVLCRQAEVNLATCGSLLDNSGTWAHVYCLFFANNLGPAACNLESETVFCPEDIRRTVEQAAEKKCFICKESGATITCQETGCERSFHLPCAARGQCTTQYFAHYKSYCSDHSPEQIVEATPEKGTYCLICTDSVDDQKSYRTMVCPACKHAWFHRDCIQGQSLCAGLCFQCPLCRDREVFMVEMLILGIRITLRLPSWEEDFAVNELNERHGRCDASHCLCPGGREQADRQGPWQLLLCRSCAACGTHRQCSLSPGVATWECLSCAGPSTASMARAQTDNQSGLEPSLGSPAANTRSSSIGGSRRSSHHEPVWVRENSRLRRREEIPSSQPRGHSERSRSPLSRNESSSPSQAVLGPTDTVQVPDSTSPTTNSSCRSSRCEPVWVRENSRLRRREEIPSSQHRRLSERSRSPLSRTESSTPSQAVPGPSHSWMVPVSNDSTLTVAAAPATLGLSRCNARTTGTAQTTE